MMHGDVPRFSLCQRTSFQTKKFSQHIIKSTTYNNSNNYNNNKKKITSHNNNNNSYIKK